LCRKRNRAVCGSKQTGPLSGGPVFEMYVGM
jgi:hypothetical protein